MDFLNLYKILEKNNQPKFRAEQIILGVLEKNIFDFEKIPNIPKNLKEIIFSEMDFFSFFPMEILSSKNDPAFKALLKLKDGFLIETVLISSKPNFWSVCLSVQVGCPVGCEFCATGKMGFERNLTVEEITDQVLFWRKFLWEKENLSNDFLSVPKTSQLNFNQTSKFFNDQGKRVDNQSKHQITNLVFMGMGEPFLNWENVSAAIKTFTNSKIFNLASRRISVSTVGIAPMLEVFAREFPQVNLAISLHFADDKKRQKFMPINLKHSLTNLKEAIKKYLAITKRKVFIEYAIFEGLNDRKEDLEKLVEFNRSFKAPHLFTVNLINSNPIAKNEKEDLSDERKVNLKKKEKIWQIKNYLLKNKIDVTARKSLGKDIFGACGQLADRRVG